RLTTSELELADASGTPSPTQDRPLPSLPNEVIREIIRHATNTSPAQHTIHAAGSFDSHVPSTPPFPYWSCCLPEDEQVHHKLYSLSMKIKRSVSLVSCTWRDLALEFLCNSIRIRSSNQLAALLRAFEADARRRGVDLTEDGSAVAAPGSAPWWVREMWIDWEVVDRKPPRYQTASANAKIIRNVSYLLRICSNVAVYRGIASPRAHPLRLWINPVVFRQMLNVSLEGIDIFGADAQREEMQTPESDRQIGLYLENIREPFSMVPRNNRPNFQIPATSSPTFTLSNIRTMELRNIRNLGSATLEATIRLPGLTHLTIWGLETLKYVTANFALPELRNATFGKRGNAGLGSHTLPYLEQFLQRHGLNLEELTVLDQWCPRQPVERITQFCPVFRSFGTHYMTLQYLTAPGQAVLGVTTLRLYGLEDTITTHDSGDNLARNVIKAFPAVTTVHDASWRSDVIRRRAFTNWRDPQGEIYRTFWAKFLLTLQKLWSDRAGMDRPGDLEVLDWRRRTIGPVPAEPPIDECDTMTLEDRLLDDLVSGVRLA
ncbi:hypothetical protein FRB90_002247, partial [Tulasnella sp. 427]